MARVKEKNRAAPLPTAKSKEIFVTKSKNFVLQLTYQPILDYWAVDKQAT